MIPRRLRVAWIEQAIVILSARINRQLILLSLLFGLVVEADHLTQRERSRLVFLGVCEVVLFVPSEGHRGLRRVLHGEVLRCR